MSSGDYRHHRAVQIVFVGGSPEPPHRVKPRQYPVQRRELWRPRTKPPNRKVSGEAIKRLLDEFNRQDEVVRAMMSPRPDLVAAWLSRGSILKEETAHA